MRYRSLMLSVLSVELRIQIRSGLTFLYLGMPLLWIAVAYLFPESARPTVVLIGLFADPVMMGLVFTGAFLARERDQGLLDAWAVTPMGAGHWLAGRFLVIAVEGTLGGLILVTGSGVAADFAVLVPALFLASGCMALTGLLVARPFRDIMTYFLAGGITSALVSLPVGIALVHTGWYLYLTGPVWSAWNPMSSSLGLTFGAVDGSAPFSTAAADLAVLAAWTAALFLLDRRIYLRGFFRRPSRRTG